MDITFSSSAYVVRQPIKVWQDTRSVLSMDARDIQISFVYSIDRDSFLIQQAKLVRRSLSCQVTVSLSATKNSCERFS
jgi:hypothetical protein